MRRSPLSRNSMIITPIKVPSAPPIPPIRLVLPNTIDGYHIKFQAYPDTRLGTPEHPCHGEPGKIPCFIIVIKDINTNSEGGPPSG